MTTRNIYIVDDDDAVRGSLHSLLSLRSDLAIRTFRSGDQFLATIHDLEAGVAILDYDMPGATGVDILEEIGARKLPVIGIILTGQGNIPLAVRAVRAGAHDFLEKPCDHEVLNEVIAQAFEKLASTSAPVARQEEAKAKIARLSKREHDVLLGLIEGQSNKVIAHELDISARTVEIYRANLMDKLEVRSLSEALRIAFTASIVPLA